MNAPALGEQALLRVMFEVNRERGAQIVRVSV
jgi:hypothetical protein